MMNKGGNYAMQIKRPNCEVCIHSEVCFQKKMAQSIVEDMGKVKHFNTKEYASLMTCFSMKLECQHFLKKAGEEAC